LAYGEAEKIAEFLGIPITQLFEQRLAIDYWIENSGDILYLIPSWGGVKPGRMMSYGDAFERGRCTFLTDENKCSIHEVKPSECREALSCDPERPGGEIGSNVVDTWRPHQKYIRQFDGDSEHE